MPHAGNYLKALVLIALALVGAVLVRNITDAMHMMVHGGGVARQATR